MSEPAVTDAPDLSRYELRLGDEVAGVVTYEIDGGVADLRHTEIEPGHEGEGLGGTLARGVLDDLRTRGLKVKPSCPFIEGWIEKHPDYEDLVA